MLSSKIGPLFSFKYSEYKQPFKMAHFGHTCYKLNMSSTFGEV